MILVGIRPEVAQAIVGLDVRGMATLSDLQTALLLLSVRADEAADLQRCALGELALKVQRVLLLELVILPSQQSADKG